MNIRRGISLFVALVVIAAGVFLWSQNKEGATRLASSIAALTDSVGTEEGSSAESPAGDANLSHIPDLPEGVTVDTWEEIRQDIEKRQWEIRAVQEDDLPEGIDADYWAPNPVHNLKSYFTDDGVSIRSYKNNDDNPWDFFMNGG